MNRHPIIRPHLIQFINTRNTLVSKDHGTRFQDHSTRLLAKNRSRQSSSSGPTPRSVQASRRNPGNILKELTLRSARVSYDQRIGITTYVYSVGHVFRNSPE